eukprot:287085-Prymnesium_polylepis.1
MGCWAGQCAGAAGTCAHTVHDTVTFDSRGHGPCRIVHRRTRRPDRAARGGGAERRPVRGAVAGLPVGAPGGSWDRTNWNCSHSGGGPPHVTALIIRQ